MVDQKREVRKIPVDKVPPGHMEAELVERIRYEMKSAKMCQAFSLGVVRETSEIIEWLQAYHVLQRLQGEIPTTGIPGTTSEPSTKTG